MKTPFVIALLLVAAIAVTVYEYKRAVAFAAVVSERDGLNHRLNELSASMRETKTREAIPTPAWIAPAPAVVPATPPESPREEPVPSPGISITAPDGWFKNGSNPGGYVVGVDQLQTWGGMPSAYARSNGASEKDFGGMMQMTLAEDYLGQRLRMRGWIKTENADEGGGHLWMRVDGHQAGATLQFDNMDNRAVTGTSDWQECAIVLDVPANANAIAFGFFLKGRGKMWVSGTTIEPVGADVASTNRVTVTAQAKGPARKTYPTAPINLGFYPGAPK